MRFELPDEARELRAGLRAMLADACPPAVVRDSWPGGDTDSVDALWTALGQLGLLGLLVPEPAGGLGLDEVVAVGALEECGYAGVPGPVVETVLCAAPLLAEAADARLPAVLRGEARVAVQAVAGALVPYGQHSTLVLSLDGPPEVLVSAEASIVGVDTVDGSRGLAQVSGRGERLPVEARAVERARQGATLGSAAFLLGLARRQLDLTVGYVNDRQQFGVPVGSFQAVKHPLADACVATEFAWPAVLRAAASMSTDDPSTAVHVSIAKALASDAAWRMSRTCIQAHGAMGYTVEYDLHLYVKRTWAMAYDWGNAAEHRALVAAHLGLDEGNPR